MSVSWKVQFDDQTPRDDLPRRELRRIEWYTVEDKTHHSTQQELLPPKLEREGCARLARMKRPSGRKQSFKQK